MSAESHSSLLRVLALHGKGNTGTSFQRALEPLECALSSRTTSEGLGLSFEFEYMTAPFELGGREEEEEGQRAWWTLPPGKRSFNAKEYVGYDKSASMVEEALRGGDGYDIIIGHSQGAILLSALLATSERFTDQGRTDEKSLRIPTGFIFNGAAWPNPVGDRLEEFTNAPSQQQSLGPERKALFVIGDRDTINPPDGAERVRDCLARGGMPVTTCRHPGGHSVPVRDEKALAKIVDWMIQFATEKEEAPLSIQ